MRQTVAEGTYRVSELCEELKLFVGEAFPRLWVQGEVQRLNRSRAGHVYFELVEKGDGQDIRAKLDAVIWASDMRLVDAQLRRAGVTLEDGVELRLLGGMDLYPPQGRLQLRVRRVDPDFLLGRVERQRRETLRQLVEKGLVDRNRQRPLPAVPLRLALVTSVASAAYHDFVTTLAESGWGFTVQVVDTVVQGSDAPAAVASALDRAGRTGVDAVVLVRGGGARSDLHAFDTTPIAMAIATCPLPVIVGLGHQIDVSVSDQVAHTSTKTPTGAASFLVERVDAANAARVEVGQRIVTAARNRVEREGRRLARSGLRVTRSLERITGARGRLRDLTVRLRLAGRRRLDGGHERWKRVCDRLPAAGNRRVVAGSEQLRQVARRLVVGCTGRTRTARRQLEAQERLVVQLSPQRLLERGFSIARTAAGVVVRSQTQLELGDRLLTRLADGTVGSRVEDKEEQDEQ